MQQNNGVGPNIGELVKDLLIRGYRIPDPERILPFLSMDDDIGSQIEDVINPAATEEDGGLTQEQVIQQLMQGGQPPQGRDIRTQPVPRESAIQGDAMKASEGSGVDSLRQTGDG